MGGILFWSTHIHTQDRLDKPRSALAEARLKTLLATTLIKSSFLLLHFSFYSRSFTDAFDKLILSGTP